MLTHAGTVSHRDAVTKAKTEYESFAAQQRGLPSLVEKHFEEAIDGVKQLEQQRSPRAKKTKRKATRRRKQ